MLQKRRRGLRRGLVVLTALVALLITGCSSNQAKVPTFTGAGKVKVATSFYPLYELAVSVGGDHVQAINLVPPGTEPHEWEPTPAHIKSLNSAQLFLYNGAGFEHWVDQTLKALDNKGLVVVEASKGFRLIRGEHESGAYDPHIWLDPHGAIHMVEMIRGGLIQVDPANRATYEANAATQIAKLQALDEEFQTGLATCKTRTFFTSHDAFGYLANRYNLTQHPIMGLSPDVEPTPADLKKVVNEAKANQVTYIFFETLVSDKVAKVVASEIGAKTLVLNPFEGLTDEEIKAGQSYLTVMRGNLANLKTALECDK